MLFTENFLPLNDGAVILPLGKNILPGTAVDGGSPQLYSPENQSPDSISELPALCFHLKYGDLLSRGVHRPASFIIKINKPKTNQG